MFFLPVLCCFFVCDDGASNVNLPIVLQLEAKSMSAKMTDETIAQPLAKEFAKIPSVRRVRTLSVPGRCFFELTPAVHESGKRVPQEALANFMAVAEKLPSECRKKGISLLPPIDDSAIMVAITSDGVLEPAASLEVVEKLKSKFETISNVAFVAPYGLPRFQIHAYVDPDRLARFQLSHKELVKQFLEHEVQLEKGTVGALTSLDELGKRVVTTISGQAVCWNDIARIELSANGQHDCGIAGKNQNGTPSFGCPLLFVHPAPNHFATVASSVEKLVSELRSELPPGYSIIVQSLKPNCQACLLLLPSGTSRRIDFIQRAVALLLQAKPTDSFLWRWEPNANAWLILMPEASGRSSFQSVNDLPGVKTLVPPSGCWKPAGYCWQGKDYPVNIRLRGADLDALRALAQKLKVDWRSQKRQGELVLQSFEVQSTDTEIDRNKAKMLGLMEQDLQTTVRLASAGITAEYAGTMKNPDLAISLGGPADPNELLRLTLPNKQGERIPLGTVVRVQSRVSQTLIERENGEYVLALGCSANLPSIEPLRSDLKSFVIPMQRKGITIEVE